MLLFRRGFSGRRDCAVVVVTPENEPKIDIEYLRIDSCFSSKISKL